MAKDKPPSWRVYAIDIEELLDKAFSRASEAADKEDVSGLKPIMKAKIKERVRLKVAIGAILNPISRLERAIPPRSALEPFYQELLETLGAEALESARRRIARATRNVKRLRARAFTDLDRARGAASMHVIRRTAYGRISSEVRSLRPCMEYLEELRPKLRELPTIKFDLPTVVIAGCPNVGKTTLLRSLTGSEPEIRPIPFTTQRIQLGYYAEGWTKIQVIDTPGLLDRPIEERNPLERKAIGAIRHLSNMVVFMIDPTTRSGFPLDDQLGLLGQIRETFPTRIVIAVNKADIASPEEAEAAVTRLPADLPVVKVCSLQPEGVKGLRSMISSYLLESDENLSGQIRETEEMD
jgi:nucleolar GTP-binding protein